MITETQLNLFEELRAATLNAVRNVGFKSDVLVEVEIEYMQLVGKLIDRANKPVPAMPIVPDLAPATPVVITPAPAPAQIF